VLSMDKQHRTTYGPDNLFIIIKDSQSRHKSSSLEPEMIFYLVSNARVRIYSSPAKPVVMLPQSTE
jgi:hypothetical protein